MVNAVVVCLTTARTQSVFGTDCRRTNGTHTGNDGAAVVVPSVTLAGNTAWQWHRHNNSGSKYSSGYNAIVALIPVPLVASHYDTIAVVMAGTCSGGIATGIVM